MKKLEGKVAVVTGASKGIGAGIARALAEDGAAVVVNYAASRDDADRVVAEIEHRGGRAIAVQADVAKQADVVRLFAETRKACQALWKLNMSASINTTMTIWVGRPGRIFGMRMAGKGGLPQNRPRQPQSTLLLDSLQWC